MPFCGRATIASTGEVAPSGFAETQSVSKRICHESPARLVDVGSASGRGSNIVPLPLLPTLRRALRTRILLQIRLFVPAFPQVSGPGGVRT